MVHDPGQAWNALTVGAYTERTAIVDPTLHGWTPLAPLGDLSPSSTTTLNWIRGWPLKPDVVFEGGNMARSPSGDNAQETDSLLLLTTNWKPLRKQFSTSGETSGATALASRMAALIWSRYPEFWPETVRALMVHSAEHTQAMKNRFPERSQRRQLLRYCGFGVAGPTLRSLERT